MYKYEIKYWDDIDCKVCVCRGLLGAANYVAAMQEAVKYCSPASNPGEGIIEVTLCEFENPLDIEEIQDWLKEEGAL